MNILGLQRSSTVDFPGLLSCVVFFGGCDLNCFFCHNRALLRGQGERIGEDALFAFLEKRRGLLDGVVLSGGEPTLQRGLAPFLERLHALSYKTMLETNGQRPALVWELVDRGLLDYLAVDLKCLPEDGPSVCGKNAYLAAASTLHGLLERGVPFEARTTLYPGLSLEALEQLLASLPPLPRWQLNFFRPIQDFLPCHEERLRLPALSPSSVQAALPLLLQHQPGLLA